MMHSMGKGLLYATREDPDQHSLFINIYSRLSLSRNPRDSMKHFEIFILQHIRFAELRKKIIKQPPLTE